MNKAQNSIIGQKRPRLGSQTTSIDLTSEDPVAKKAQISPQGKNSKIDLEFYPILAKPAQGGDRKMRSYGASSPSSQATDQLKIDTIVGTIRKRFYTLD